MKNVAKKILGARGVKRLPNAGARNVGFYVSVGEHKYSDRYKRVSCKFYKGDGSTKGFVEGYMPFHKDAYQKQKALNDNPYVLQSLDAGVAQDKAGKTYPYAVFEYVEGVMLRDFVNDKSTLISKEEARAILSDMFLNVWIPVWAAGIRFQDGQTGNWVVGDDKKTYMIDTEQMRKDVFELENTPDIWTQRDKHEKLGLKKIAGIFADLCNKASVPMTDPKSKKILEQTDFISSLQSLGKNPNNSQAQAHAETEFKKLLALFLP